MIASIMAKAAIVTTIFKLIFFCHNFAAIDYANTANRDFIILFHSSPPFLWHGQSGAWVIDGDDTLPLVSYLI